MNQILRAGCGCVFLPLSPMPVGVVDSEASALQFEYILLEYCGGDLEDRPARVQVQKGNIRQYNLDTAQFVGPEYLEGLLKDLQQLLLDGYKFRELKGILS